MHVVGSIRLIFKVFYHLYQQVFKKYSCIQKIIINITINLNIETCIKTGILVFLICCLYRKGNIKLKFSTSANARSSRQKKFENFNLEDYLLCQVTGVNADLILKIVRDRTKIKNFGLEHFFVNIIGFQKFSKFSKNYFLEFFLFSIMFHKVTVSIICEKSYIL